ncbi:hypothetical protein [Stieleria varia]|uniref:DUF4261 domain-containing protein n=1 Tax=Stieleria varia TaxID=2528005 RepID=A0A5C5ZQP7_9BACT|nr:hypothetical protein [Stieleria varia]TWT89590.1 hypothetical protein Pla52n_67170 [Stieleria varia]
MNEPVFPSAGEIADALRDRYKGSLNPTVLVDSENGIGHSFGNTMGVVQFLDFPIPAWDLAPRCETAYWWPEAAAALSDHTCHLIVQLIQDLDDRIPKVLLLTRYLAEIVKRTTSVGVYWGEGLLRSAESFLDLESTVAPTTLAPELWVDFQIHPNDAGVEQFYTYGMNILGRLEIEVDRFSLPREAMLTYARGLAKKVLEQDLVLAYDSWIDGPDGKPIRVTHGDTFLPCDGRVCKLQME